MIKTLSTCNAGHMDRNLELEVAVQGHHRVLPRTCPQCGEALVAILSYPV